MLVLLGDNEKSTITVRVEKTPEGIYYAKSNLRVEAEGANALGSAELVYELFNQME
ncbi:hypothetical protein GJU40_13740 [Bacillus lacus]|uniref:Uncharacterized protein n=1 Tax=Metabacillus lacus TaxID=1983721 RepID=A0A7X2LZA7_9BACI|nr:hypothetical protein [Metabacillus lacus]MRX73206.1 hypothetical protein [Metabacillus lacus]